MNYSNEYDVVSGGSKTVDNYDYDANKLPTSIWMEIFESTLSSNERERVNNIAL